MSDSIQSPELQFYPSTPAPKNKLPGWGIALIVLGSLGVLGMIAFVAFFALAAPVFTEEVGKANDLDVKADVATLGKEVATYYVEYSEPPLLTAADGVVTLADPAGTQILTYELSPEVEFGGFTGTHRTNWCVWATHPAGVYKSFQYSAAKGLEAGEC